MSRVAVLEPALNVAVVGCPDASIRLVSDTRTLTVRASSGTPTRVSLNSSVSSSSALVSTAEMETVGRSLSWMVTVADAGPPCRCDGLEST